MLEIFTAACGLVQSVLIMFKRKENWIFYLLNIISLTVYSFTVALWGDVLENIIYIIFGLLGLCTWYNKNISEKVFKKENRIKYCTSRERIIYGSMLLFISVVVFLWLSKTNDPAPLLDGVTTAMGFTATLMMAFKRVDAWFVWFVDDILMAYVYFTLPNPAVYLCVLNIIWIALAVGTWYVWHKEAKSVIGDVCILNTDKQA